MQCTAIFTTIVVPYSSFFICLKLNVTHQIVAVLSLLAASGQLYDFTGSEVLVRPGPGQPGLATRKDKKRLHGNLHQVRLYGFTSLAADRGKIYASKTVLQARKSSWTVSLIYSYTHILCITKCHFWYNCFSCQIFAQSQIPVMLSMTR